ncbi:hypothetical protein D910_11386 [Dendroctonus ponderosae]
MLKTQLFIGSYEEKRYVEAVDSYRDVVRIDSDETQFIGNLEVVTRKLKQEFYNETAWIGITDPNTIGAPAGYSLWTVLPIGVFGKYWFKVKSVAFTEQEVRLKLDVVRPLRSEQSTADSSGISASQDFDLKTSLLDASSSVHSSFTSWIKTNLTLTNIRSTVIFLSLLLTTIIAGAINLVKYLMEYSLKVMNQTSKIIEVCTPILITCIELVRSILFGILSMIVTLLRGKQLSQQVIYVPSPNPPRQYMLQYPTKRSARQRGSSVTIQPIDD